MRLDRAAAAASSLFVAALLLGSAATGCGSDPANGTGGSAAGAGQGGSGGGTGQGGEPDPTDALFAPDHVLEVAIEMAPADWDALRFQSRSVWSLLGEGCQDAPHASPYDYFSASVTVDGVLLDNSGVRKKGFLGSASLSRPSLKISFDEYVEGREAFGVEGLTLNNSKQDDSLVKTCLAFQVFRDAGGAASRCNFAHVTVNGADLGVYAHVEPVNKRMLARHFPDDTGNLYEGQISDFREGWLDTYEKKTNEADPDRSDLDALASALTAPDAELEAALAPVLDIDAFTRFWATEVLVAAYDGYAGNTNNHLVYHEPSSGKMMFLPWGPDMSFDDSDPFHPPNAPYSVLAKGHVARRLYEVPALRERYVARMKELLATVWNEDALLAEVDRVQALVTPYLGGGAGKSAAAADVVRSFISARRATLEAELASPPNWPYPAPAEVCLPTAGTASGTFSTTFGSLAVGDLAATGDGTLDMAIPANMPATADVVGAGAGWENAQKESAQLIVGAKFPDGKVRALVFNVAPEIFASGKDGIYDWQSIFAQAYDIDANGNPTSLGILADGALHFDQADTKATAPVTGSFTATLLKSPFQ